VNKKDLSSAPYYAFLILQLLMWYWVKPYLPDDPQDKAVAVTLLVVAAILAWFVFRAVMNRLTTRKKP
jgi:membrane-bound metal-dependent hydrolase YbcI (DUF457 family)